MYQTMSERDTKRARARLLENGIMTRRGSYYLPNQEFTPETGSEGWLQRGLNINVPKAVIDTIVVETVKQSINTELNTEIKQITKYMIISMFVIPLALISSFISFITAIVFLSMGAWITSIPFILTSVFGVYFFYLNKNPKRYNI